MGDTVGQGVWGSQDGVLWWYIRPQQHQETPWSGALGDPLQLSWSLVLGAWLLPPTMVGVWELEQIIPQFPSPPKLAGSPVLGSPCLHSTVLGSQHLGRATSRCDPAMIWGHVSNPHP